MQVATKVVMPASYELILRLVYLKHIICTLWVNASYLMYLRYSPTTKVIAAVRKDTQLLQDFTYFLSFNLPVVLFSFI